nr:MAG TPA: hypothetical protein [Caudoviricetes sp.]
MTWDTRVTNRYLMARKVSPISPHLPSQPSSAASLQRFPLQGSPPPW